MPRSTTTCVFCGYQSSNGGNFHVHIRTHTGERPYNCKTCGNSFKHVSALKRHQVIHSSEQPFRCNQCDKQFSHSSNLKRHKDNIHIPRKQFKCNICGKLFSHKLSVPRHLRSHSDSEALSNPPKSGTSQTSNRRVSSRNRQVKKSENTQPCTVQIKTKAAVKQCYTQSVPLPFNAKTYKCERCDKSFWTRGNLRAHTEVIHNKVS